jgi:hypothetical protein
VRHTFENRYASGKCCFSVLFAIRESIVAALAQLQHHRETAIRGIAARHQNAAQREIGGPFQKNRLTLSSTSSRHDERLLSDFTRPKYMWTTGKTLFIAIGRSSGEIAITLVRHLPQVREALMMTGSSQRCPRVSLIR